MPSISSLVSIRTGWNSRRPSRVRLRIAVISRSILPIDDLMKPSASVEILRELLVGAFEHGLGGIGGVVRRRTARRLRAGKRRDPPEDVAAQFLEFAGEAHDVDQRRAQIVADDIGEALDLVVGFAQVGGAFVDGGFEIEVVVAQLRFGLVARARRAPHQEDRDAGEHDHEAGAGDRHDEASIWRAVGGRRYASTNSRSSSARIGVASVVDRFDGVAAPCRRATIAMRAGDVACFDAGRWRCANSSSRCFDRAAAARRRFRPGPGLSPISLRQLVDVGQDGRQPRPRTRRGMRVRSVSR